MTFMRQSDGDIVVESQPPSPSNVPFLHRPSLRRSCGVRKFSCLVSTEDYHAEIDRDAVYGPYAHLRKILLKVSNHYQNYTQQRQWLQDAIIDDFLDNVEDPDRCITPTEPWLIFTVGARGAGKHHILHDLVHTGRLPILSFVQVDPDSIRRRLPEFATYAANNPILVNDLMRKESSFMAELLLMASLQNGRNVVFDSAMRNPDWFLNWINMLKSQCSIETFGLFAFPKIALFHVTAPTNLILQRAEKKSKETKRVIHQDSILKSLETIPSSLEVVRPSVDFYCQIENGADSYYIVDGNVKDWDEFHAVFLQACAWKPGMKGKQQMERQLSVQETTDANESAIRKAKETRQPFSVLISSEENNKSDDKNFYGKYSHIRKTLDYSYHCNYTFERQKLQDAIITDMLHEAFIVDPDGNVGTVPTEPWIVFTAGAMGAGKSHTMNILVKHERFPLHSFVGVDPDEIRRLLPEFHMYINENPELAGDLTRKEAGYIAEILTLAALQVGKNVLQDGSLRDSEWYRTYFERLRREFPKVRQAIIHVTAPREAVFQRAEARAKMTGRVVPRELLEKTLAQVPKSVEILAPLVDYYAEINNPPDSEDVELVKPTGSTWEEFRRQWVQDVAYADDKGKVIKKAITSKHRLDKCKSSLEACSLSSMEK
ncbi:zeta toxin family protein [Nitzschia inconspicua]|uniref:Zeta toxin family protein n=1 Tax=Nitzschia inconspicua TaxID=303405 RepID=A0A9K3L781_9STRA|nr:zeta toxin family protein [Nitzschia inconspicua]